MFDRKKYMKEWRKKNKRHIRGYDNYYYYTHLLAGRQQAKKWKDTHHEYAIWLNMLRRCNKPNERAYKNYGGRGIKVLYEDFYAFLSDVGCWPGFGYSIDRINNNESYTRGNCRWATAKEQRHNQRRMQLVHVQ